MTCQWHHNDCKNLNNKCFLCVTDSQYYEPVEIKRYSLNKKAAKPDNRKGSNFEYKNHIKNEQLLNSTSTRMTPNSGAGYIKGDEEIVGLINIMEELKTQDKTTSRGDKTFSIKKSWLEKLHNEAMDANKEFWYLKFSFGKDDESFIISEEDMIMGMVYTMYKDRQKAIKLEQEIERLQNIISKK